MNKSINRNMMILFAVMFIYTGCAKQEVVKKDEPINSSVTKPATGAEKPSIATLNKSTSVANASPLNSTEAKKAGHAGEPTVAEVKNALEKIYFDFDSSELDSTARQTLTKNFAVLKQKPKTMIRVEGNCDERGSAEYNLALGERRAKAAIRYLTTLGISAERLSSISYGEEKPEASGHDESSWARNRRDEFIVIK